MDDTRIELQTRSSCAACKIRKRKCGDECLLAPYFPQDNPESFLTTTKLFKASKISKIIKHTPPEKRSDAVKSMVYEASVRKRDPVNGCAGVLGDLEKHVFEMQLQLAAAKAELARLRTTHPQSSITGISPKVEPAETISDLTYRKPHSSITGLPPKVEPVKTISDLTYRKSQELDLIMDDIIMGTDNSDESCFWETIWSDLEKSMK